MLDRVYAVADIVDKIGDATDIITTEVPRRKRFDRRIFGIALIIIAIFLLVSAILDTVKYYSSVEDYHSLASNHIRYGSMVNGTIDKWCGPYGKYNDGREIYLLEVDNGQLIPFITNDEEHKEEFIAYGKNNADAVEIELEGKIQSMSEDLKSVLFEKLAEEGLSRQYIEKILIHYTLVNDKANLFDYRCKLGIVLGGIGMIMLLPEYNNFLNSTNKRKNKNKPTNGRTSNYFSYNNQQATQQERYRTYASNRYTAQGQNRENR